jgi:hypothetical protein
VIGCVWRSSLKLCRQVAATTSAPTSSERHTQPITIWTVFVCPVAIHCILKHE